MSKTKTLPGAVIGAMSKTGAFRTAGYRLHKDFAGDYTIDNVIPFANRQSDKGDDNAYRVQCNSESGNHSLNGFLMSNAYLVPKSEKIDAKSIKDGVDNVFYWDDVQDVIRNSRYLNTEMEDDNDFTFPEKFKIIGAVVSKDTKGDHPYVPLRRYPFYTTILRHHKEKADRDATYVDRDTIDIYINSEGDDRPNLPKGYKFKMVDHDKAVWKMENWNPTLLIEDWTEKE